MEAVLIALVSMLGGTGGVAVIVRAILDFRSNHANRELDVDERYTIRMEKRLNGYEDRIATLEFELRDERRYVTILSITLARAGLPVPERDVTDKSKWPSEADGKDV